jgi:hypothetical protein
MGANYLRLFVFWKFLGPLSRKARQKRMRRFLDTMDVREGTSILDLGGYAKFWDAVGTPLNLTILNLPGEVEPHRQGCEATHHKIQFVVGDACNVSEFEDNSFDIVFSNSVIEHVGSAEKRAQFAREARRIGASYWVQTPSKWFPIEAHSGMPFWFFYPAQARIYFIKRWRESLEGNPWIQMIEETTVLSKSELRRLFPDGTIIIEWLFGMPKSYVVYSKPHKI